MHHKKDIFRRALCLETQILYNNHVLAALIRGKVSQLLTLNNPNELSCSSAHVLIRASESIDSNAKSIPFPIKNKCAVHHTGEQNESRSGRVTAGLKQGKLS